MKQILRNTHLRYFFPLEVVITVLIAGTVGIFALSNYALRISGNEKLAQLPSTGTAPAVEHNEPGNEYNFTYTMLEPHEVQTVKETEKVLLEANEIYANKIQIVERIRNRYNSILNRPSLQVPGGGASWGIDGFPSSGNPEAAAITERFHAAMAEKEDAANSRQSAQEAYTRAYEAAEERYLFFTNLPTASRQDLIAIYPNIDGEQQTAILEELLKRDSRATTITGEFNTAMIADARHNAFVLVTRGRLGQDSSGTAPELVEFANKTTSPEAFKVTDTRTTQEVGVKLLGADFEIEPAGMIWKTIPDGHYATYDWIVTPKTEGQNKEIYIEVVQRISIGEKEIVLPVKRFPQAIEISADFGTLAWRFLTNTQSFLEAVEKVLLLIVAILGVGGIGALWSWIKSRIIPRRNEPEANPTSAESAN